MCVGYCGSFPLLFSAVDREIESGRADGAETVSAATIRAVSDHCWQCKLCYLKCPYTPDEGAYELLDIPRLLAREKALRARREGVPFVDRVLGEPAALGALASGPQARLANLVNKNRLVRKAAERTTGISAEFPLPPIASRRFTSWFAAHEPRPEAGGAGSVVLYPTCYGEHHFPGVPEAATRVLERNGFSVIVPEGLTCCGMPNLDGGDVEAARKKIEANLAALHPFVEQGLPIVVPGPTCGYTLKKEWPLYVDEPAVRAVAGATRDLMEFLDVLRREKRLNREFSRGYGKVAYHAACHLRAQKVAVPGARVLAALPDTEVRIIERCSAVDGTWGMKAAYYEEGRRYARRLTEEVESAEENGETEIVTDCSLAALRIFKENRRNARHPIELLAAAYGDA